METDIKPLLSAASRGDVVKVRALLRDTSVDINARSGPKKETALESAICEGKTSCVRALVEEYNYGQPGYENVITQSELARFLALTGPTFGELRKKDGSPAKSLVIINCVGLIPHRKKEQSNEKYVVLNALLPQILDELCKQNGCKLIHISTDCVFDGEKHFGTYTEDSVPNARDMYGRSKALGEMIDSTVIRTSIIGEELNNKYSLLEWVKSNKGGEINGFTNQRWSGVTCLTVAKIMEKIVSEKLYWNGVRNLESTDVTKYELVSLINAVYDLGIKINPVEAEHYHDKVLTTVLPKIFDIPTISAQIEELSEFNLS